jgi:hypothetical protein
MKRIVTLILVGAVWAISSLAIAKEKEKESSQPSSTVAAAEHKMFAPADIKWVDGPPGVKLAVLGRRSGQARAFHNPPSSAGWI